MDAYFAGLFDGEGCVAIRRYSPMSKWKSLSPRYTLKVTICMTHEETVLKLKEYFGFGNIHQRKHSNIKYKTSFAWEASAGDAQMFMERVRPYVITKRAEIELGFEFQKI